MTNNQLTKEWLQNRIADMESTRDDIPFGFDEDGNNELAAYKLALAAMDSEPLGWCLHGMAPAFTADKEKAEYWMSRGWDVLPLYRHAQPAPKRDQVRSEHAEWSRATFGNVGPIGPLKHLRKEALEAAAEPGDLSEWADMQFLLWDAQRRAGITDEQVTQAMIEKLAVNKQREWPEPKDGEPRLHIKAQPAPVVPDEMTTELAWSNMGVSGEYSEPWSMGWNACRAAMLKAGTFREISETSASSLVIPDQSIPVSDRMTVEDTNYRGFWRVTVWTCLICVIFFWLPAISVAIYYFSSGN